MITKTTIATVTAVTAIGAGTAFAFGQADRGPRATVATATSTQSARQQGMGNGQGRHGQGMGQQGSGAGTAATPLKVTATERKQLLLMREEEKLANDVYVVLARQYPDAPFAQIATSEARHASAVQRQLDRAGIADPTIGSAVGEFDNAKLQKLYDALIARGSASLTEALKVGALVEETDIADLRKSLKGVKDAQLKRVYTNLERASGQHLRIFTTALKDAGVTYAPTVLTQRSYDAISVPTS
jgi:hypothetical protein